MRNCKNCNAEINLNYCANCGQPSSLKRIDAHYITHEIEHVLHFERGILYTVRELLTSPGQNVKNYISENRSRLVKPIIFIIITSLIYSLVNHFFHIEEGYVNYKVAQKSATVVIFKWIQDHYGYANIIMGLFIAFWTKIFFKKYGYNFFEILILLCFVMGMGMLILAVFSIIQGITHINLMQIGGILSLIYATWAIGQFFDKKKTVNYFKALVSYILGMTTFFLLAITSGTIIDLMIKH
jgi:hypothetical protein